MGLDQVNVPTMLERGMDLLNVRVVMDQRSFPGIEFIVEMCPTA